MNTPNFEEKRKAFALVLAIGAMAFMVLLTLTLSAIVSSKLRLMNAQKDAHAARTNAILGMSVAISELQKTLGRDNAISFPASVFDTEPTTPNVDGVMSPYYVGALKLENENTDISAKDLQDERLAIVEKIRAGGSDENVSWLVSSQRRMTNPLVQSIEELNSETVNLSEFKTITQYPDSFGGQVNKSQNGQTVTIKAGKVILGNSSNSPTEGAYAWYVSDESMKAKLNIYRPEEYLDKNGNIQNTEDPRKFAAPSDTRLPQSVNVSFIDELVPFSLNAFLSDYQEENAKTMQKLSGMEELPLIDSSLSEWAKENKNDFTLNSVGLPVDVTQGRLKEDLTAYLDGDYGLDDGEVIVRGNKEKSDSEYKGPDLGLKDYDEYLPRFGHLKDFTQIALNKNGFTAAVKAEPANLKSSNPKHGISPIISRAEFIFLPVYTSASSEGLWDLSGRINVSLAIYLRIWIWNPHNVALDTSDYKIQLYAPFIFKMFDREAGENNSAFNAYTRWRKYNVNEDGVEVLDEAWREKVTYQSEATSGRFSDFLDAKADNGAPVLNFQVRGLKLLPGECVELTRSESATTDDTGMALYKDTDISSLSGNDNLLEVGMSVTASGENEIDQCSINAHKAFRIRMKKGNSELQMIPRNVPEELKLATYDKSNDCLTLTNETGKYIMRPVSQIAEENFTEVTLISRPYLHANFYTWCGYNNNMVKSGTVSSRIGYEIYSNSNERLFVNDLTEWDSQTSINTSNNKNCYRYLWGSTYFVSDRLNLDYARASEAARNAAVFDTNFESMLVNSAETLEDTALFDTEIRNNNYQVAFRGKGFNETPYYMVNQAAYWSWHTGVAIQVFGFRILEVGNLSNPIFLGGNLRASSVIDGNISSSNVLRRSTENYSIAPKFSASNSIMHTFMGGTVAWTNTLGSYTWDNGQIMKDSLIESGDKLIQAYASENDGRRFGHPMFLSGEGTYSYEYQACALFDYPRTSDDIMSLGNFVHANLSFFHGQPTYAFAESYASPYIDRDKIVEDSQIYRNANIDISYILNASMWDRFYISTLPKSASKDLGVGVRLSNTRHFVKTMPEETSKIVGSDDAFKNSAAYIGIDGAFNVNSTSYEAWRAFLGGMLGTVKNTLTGEQINEKQQSINEGSELAMPNPGSLNPIATPADDDKASGLYLSYKDMMVGRTITEAEIDELAREVVAEVKRRAPFFSLADFVNRRLYSYGDIEDLDMNYQSLMGTLAAAIHRSMQDTNRPKNFFNDQSLDINMAKASTPESTNINDTDENESHSQTLSVVTALNNNMQGGMSKDLGEHVKSNAIQYKEAALGGPIDGDIWNWRIAGSRGLLNQADILSMIGPVITVRGDTFTIRAYGECKNKMTGAVSKAYCEAVVQRSSDPVEPTDDIVAPESAFGRRFNIVSFRWLTPAEL